MVPLHVVATALAGNPKRAVAGPAPRDGSGAACGGPSRRGGGIHAAPPSAGQRETGSLRGVATDQAADPRHLAGDGLGLRWWQLPAMSHREEQPQQGELAWDLWPSVGQGTGRAAGV